MSRNYELSGGGEAPQEPSIGEQLLRDMWNANKRVRMIVSLVQESEQAGVSFGLTEEERALLDFDTYYQLVGWLNDYLQTNRNNQ